MSKKITLQYTLRAEEERTLRQLLRELGQPDPPPRKIRNLARGLLIGKLYDEGQRLLRKYPPGQEQQQDDPNEQDENENE